MCREPSHRAACYRRAAEPNFERPKPYVEGQGWLKTEAGVLEPVWSIGPILPPSLVDLLETVDTENDEDQQENEDAEPYPEEDIEIDYDLLMDAEEDS